MVVQVESRKLSLPNPPLLSHPSSPAPSSSASLLFDPTSLTLALMNSDSSISLYPSYSPFSSISSYLPPPQTLIPSPISSYCFLSLTTDPNPLPPSPTPRSIFVAAGPHNEASRLSLKFYLMLKNHRFVRAKLVCSQNGLDYDPKLGAVVLDASHGAKVMMSGSGNYFAVYSASAGKIWVFGVRMVGVEVEDGVDFRLVKCAVIDCCSPVTAIRVEFGWMVLGELNGVRLFELRKLVKGKVGRSGRKKGMGKGENGELNLPNGLSDGADGSAVFYGNLETCRIKGKDDGDGSRMDPCAIAEESADVLHGSKVDGKSASEKLRSLKLRQDSTAVGVCFVPFDVAEDPRSAESQYSTPEAISIQGLSRKKFLILDSNGNLHLLHMMDLGPSLMRKLTSIPQACQAAVVPDSSSSGQTVWISDGLYSIHIILVSDEEKMNENDSSNEVKSAEVSVTGAIFVCERIQDIALLASNAIMILGQDNLYAYSIS